MEKQKIKLHYFKVNSKGSTARTLLNYGKIPYEDVFYGSGEGVNQWSEHKANFSFGFMPCLEIDGKRMYESVSIFFYLAKKIGNLLGSTPEDEQRILEFVLSFDNWVKHFYEARRASGSNADEAKAKYKEEVSRWFRLYETLWKENGSGKYYLGNTLSLADIFLANTIAGYVYENKFTQEIVPDLEKEAPNVFNIIRRVRTEGAKDAWEKAWIKDSSI